MAGDRAHTLRETSSLLGELVLTFVDLGPMRCGAVWPFEETAYGCVMCPGTGYSDEPCLCDCHTDGLDILTFIGAHLGLLEVMASSWHDSEMECGQDRPWEEVREQVRLALEVPAVAEVGCACGSGKHIGDVADSMLAMAEHYGPEHEVTRRIACTWSASVAFNPMWAVDS